MQEAKKNELKIGTVGNYNVQNVILGKGNFATVYFAVHNLVGTAVAFKVIDKREIKEEYVLKNLERESRILTRLKHPNIVKLYETVKTEELYCLSLEYIKGVTLAEHLKAVRRLKEAIARSFFYQMLCAVQHMHELNVIHRDLKLENLMIEHGTVIKIVDFGLSNVYYPCKRLRTHCGSVEYAAPELFNSRSPYTTAVDMWSLGVILYVMVVGRMPFPYPRNSKSTSSRRQSLLKKISNGLSQENREHMKNLSCECWNLLHSLLEPDQFKRMALEPALGHSWFVVDTLLIKLLPRSSSHLYLQFHSDVIVYISRTLSLSENYVKEHIQTFENDDLSAMYNIVSDALVKDTMYPSKAKENSYTFRFRRRLENLQNAAESRKGLMALNKLRNNSDDKGTKSQIPVITDTNVAKKASPEPDKVVNRCDGGDTATDKFVPKLPKSCSPVKDKADDLRIGLRPTTPDTKIPKLTQEPVRLSVNSSQVPIWSGGKRTPFKSYKASRPGVAKSPYSLSKRNQVNTGTKSPGPSNIDGGQNKTVCGQPKVDCEQAKTVYGQVKVESEQAKTTASEQSKEDREQWKTSYAQPKVDYAKSRLEVGQAKTACEQPKVDREQGKTVCGQPKIDYGQSKAGWGQPKTDVGRTKTFLKQPKVDSGQAKAGYGHTKSAYAETKSFYGPYKTERKMNEVPGMRAAYPKEVRSKTMQSKVFPNKTYRYQERKPSEPLKQTSNPETNTRRCYGPNRRATPEREYNRILSPLGSPMTPGVSKQRLNFTPKAETNSKSKVPNTITPREHSTPAGDNANSRLMKPRIPHSTGFDQKHPLNSALKAADSRNRKSLGLREVNRNDPLADEKKDRVAAVSTTRKMAPPRGSYGSLNYGAPPGYQSSALRKVNNQTPRSAYMQQGDCRPNSSRTSVRSRINQTGAEQWRS